MRILLINVCLRFDSKIKHIPVGLSCIATALDRAGFRPDILNIDLNRYSDDEVVAFLEKNNFYDIVGMGNIISGYKYTKKIACQVKKAMPETLLVVGNTVATSIPGSLLRWVPQIDIAVIGEGDQTIIDIVKARVDKRDLGTIAGIAYRKGEEIIFTGPRQALKMDGIPFPDYSLFDTEKYLSVSNLAVSEPLPPVPFEQLRGLPLNTARGCIYDCTFCSHAFKQYKYRYYPFDNVVKQIEFLQEKYKINYVFFWDELTIFSVNRLKELCDAIERENIRFYWSMPTRANMFTSKDLELLKRSRALGALFMSGSLESSSPQILAAMKKKISIERYIEQVDVARRAGLEVSTSLVIGYPQETRQTIKDTLALCKKLRIYPSVGFVLPLPGTPIYDDTVKRGLITDEEGFLLKIGDRQDLHINLTSMTDEELFNTVKEELVKLKDNLKIPLSDREVIKTTSYKISKK